MKKTAALMAAVMMIANVVFAQEDDGVFLSLTKKAEFFKKLPTNISVINNKDINDKNVANISDLVAQETGLSASKTGSLGSTSNIMLRGCASEQLLVLIDGRRLNEPGPIDLSAIPLNSVERVEIIRGAASAMYGSSAFGGIINIITKRPKEDTTETLLDITFGTFQTQNSKMQFNTRKENAYLMLSGEKNISQGFRENSAYKNLNFFVRSGGDIAVIGKLDLSVSYYKSKLEVPGLGPVLDAYDGIAETKASSPNAAQEDEKKYVKLEHEYKLSNANITSNIYHSNDNRRYTDPLWGGTDTITNPVNYGFDTRWQSNDDLTIGGEATLEEYSTYNRITRLYEIDKSRTNSSLFAQKRFTIANLFVVPSVRYDDNSSFNSVFSPNLSVVYELNEAFKLSSNVGKAWRAPTFDELYYKLDSWGYQGNSNLKPEEGISSDVGIAYNSKNFKTSLTGFLIKTNHLIAWVYDSTTFNTMTQNINETQQSGAEFTLNQRIMSGLYHKLNYTYLWAEDITNKRILHYRPCNKINYNVKYTPITDTTLDILASYTSSQETWAFAGPSQLPEYAVVDVVLTHVFGKDLEVWAKMTNITDTKYQTRLHYPTPGRAFYAGVKINFMD